MNMPLDRPSFTDPDEIRAVMHVSLVTATPEQARMLGQEWFRYIHYRYGQIMAANGDQLHFVEIDLEILDGSYEVSAMGETFVELRALDDSEERALEVLASVPDDVWSMAYKSFDHIRLDTDLVRVFDLHLGASPEVAASSDELSAALYQLIVQLGRGGQRVFDPGRLRKAIQYAGVHKIYLTPQAEDRVKLVRGNYTAVISPMQIDLTPTVANSPESMGTIRLTQPEQIDALRFASQVTNPYDSRSYVRHLHYGEKTLLATDGQRLHVAMVDLGIPKGHYNLKSICNAFVTLERYVEGVGDRLRGDWPRVTVPEGSTRIALPSYIAREGDEHNGVLENVLYRLIVALGMTKGGGFQTGHLRDAIRGGYEHVYLTPEPGCRVLITRGLHQATIVQFGDTLGSCAGPDASLIKHLVRKRYTLSIPYEEGHYSITGIRVFLKVGNQEKAFLIHEEEDGRCLTHFGTGKCIGTLTPIQLRHMKTNYTTLSDEKAARILVKRFIVRYGLEYVLDQLTDSEYFSGDLSNLG